MIAKFLLTVTLLWVCVTLWLLTPQPALAASFTVTTATDTVDTAPGNGTCADAGGQCSLRAAILEANALSGDDTISLAGSTYVLSISGRGEDGALTGDLDITTGGITLVGAGNSGETITSIINGNNIDRIFDLFEGSNVTMQRVAIMGGDNQDALDSALDAGQGGGAVRAWEANLTLDQVVVQENRSKSHGGGISFNLNPFGRPTRTTLTIANSTLEHNEATINGGAIAVGGGAFFNLDFTDVISNTARAKSTSGLSRYGGGGLYVAQGYTPLGGEMLQTTVAITDTAFAENYTSDRANGQISGSAWGGAIHLEMALVAIRGTSFTNNSAEGQFGGAIYNDIARLTVTSSTFTGNRVLNEGGAIYAAGVPLTAISDSTFTNNHAPGEVLGGGGAVSGSGQASGGEFSIINSTFEHNSAAGSGGALLVGSNSTLRNLNVISNTAGSNGGGIVVLRSTINTPTIIDQVIVRNNQAYVRGGGIENGAVLYLSNSIISQNSTVQNDGGGISNYQAFALVITNTDIISNSAAVNGGGLLDRHGTFGANNIDPRTTRLTDVLIAGNYAAGDGGGVYSLISVQLINSTISNNQAGVSGGGILTYSNFDTTSQRTLYPIQLDLRNVTLSGNRAADGGAIYQNGGVSTLNNVTIASNSATNTNGGGGIYQYKDNPGDPLNPNTITLQNTLIAQNSASTGPDCANTVLSAGNNLLGDNSGCTFSATTGDQVGTGGAPIDPLLAALGNYGGATPTHALQAGSPAINNGNVATCAVSDQRGALRLATCDIGAFEFGSTPKQAQALIFATLADKTLGDAPFPLSATASSGLAVSFSSPTPAICTVSEATVTLLAVGTCTITATQAGDTAFYAAPPVTQSFVVKAAPVNPDPDPDPNSTNYLYLPMVRR